MRRALDHGPKADLVVMTEVVMTRADHIFGTRNVGRHRGVRVEGERAGLDRAAALEQPPDQMTSLPLLALTVTLIHATPKARTHISVAR
jgi:hypothetical protein